MFSYCLGIYIWLCWKLNLKEIVFLSQDHNQLDLTELNHNVSCLVWGSAYQAHIHYIWSSMATGGSSELPDAFDYTGHLFFFFFFFKKLCFSRPMVFKSQCTSESPEKNLCFVKTQIASFQESLVLEAWMNSWIISSLRFPLYFCVGHFFSLIISSDLNLSRLTSNLLSFIKYLIKNIIRRFSFLWAQSTDVYICGHCLTLLYVNTSPDIHHVIPFRTCISCHASLCFIGRVSKHVRFSLCLMNEFTHAVPRNIC